jgi:hypothetical protein
MLVVMRVGAFVEKAIQVPEYQDPRAWSAEFRALGLALSMWGSSPMVG